MSVRALQYTATVLRQELWDEHFVRIVLGGESLASFESTNIPDEWVGLVVPGQFQSRFYTVRSWDGTELAIDIVLHEKGLVSDWARTDAVGQQVTLTEPKGSFAPPPNATWLILAGDLTAQPAMERIAESVTLPTTTYLEDAQEVLQRVESIEWPEGVGYFWMAGASSQMRAIRRHLMQLWGPANRNYTVTGYWRDGAEQTTRAVDPGPIYRQGRSQGLSDAQIWQQYDQTVQ